MMIQYFTRQNIIKLLALSCFVFSQTNGLAQDNSFKTKGKPIVKVFTHYKSNLGGNKDQSALEEMALGRAYLGYKSQLNENFSITGVIDISTKTGLYETYLKTAALTYKKDKWTVDVGLIGTKHFKTQEKFWSYRYVYKTYQDAYKYNSSADMGLSVSYQLLDYLSIDGIIQNGEGYKKLSPTGTFRFGTGLTFDLYKPLTLRLYYDQSSKPEVNRQSFSSFIGYKFKKLFRIGAEYNYQKNTGFVENHNLFGYSIYGSLNINPHLSVFARYDQHNSNVVKGAGPSPNPQAWNANADGGLFIVGAEYKIIKNISVSANYRFQSPEISNLENLNWIFLNIQFKL